MEFLIAIGIIGIPVYFLSRSLLRRYLKPGLKRTVIIWLSTVILAPVCYAGPILLFFIISDYYPNRDFSSERWKNIPDQRYEFSKDLVNSKILLGKSKEDVVEGLGLEHNKWIENYWSYDLGYRPELLNIDPDILHISFKNDRVVEVEQVFR